MNQLSRRTLCGSCLAAPFGLAAASAMAAPIDEAGFVRIGGIDQWVAIQGKDSGKPVILFLHGGPGGAMSPFLKDFIPWERDFVVANWDQRGSGKTYGRNGPATPGMNLDTLVEDAIEVADHVRSRLGRSKLVLVGWSWGSLLGVCVIRKRPDLFSAYVGTGQLVSWAQSVRSSEQWARKQATAAGDRATLKALDDTAKLPISDQRREAAPLPYLYSPSDSARISAFTGAPPYPRTGDVADWLAGEDFSDRKLGPQVSSFDIRSLGLDFSIPFFVIQGRGDHVVSFGAARAYVDDIRAPRKAFAPIDGDHVACLNNPSGFVGALRKYVLPVASERT